MNLFSRQNLLHDVFCADDLASKANIIIDPAEIQATSMDDLDEDEESGAAQVSPSLHPHVITPRGTFSKPAETTRSRHSASPASQICSRSDGCRSADVQSASLK